MPSLKTAAVFYNVNEAQIARAFLESNGVQAFVPDSHTATNLSYMTPFMGGVRVVVPEDQLEVAQKILRTQENFRLVESDEVTTDGPHFELVDKSLIPATADAGAPLSAMPREFAIDANPALTRALKAGVVGLILPVVPTVVSFYYLGRYLRFKGRQPLSVHFWLILSIDVLSLAMMLTLFYNLNFALGHR